MCSTFDPTTLSNYQECLKKNNTNNTNGTDPDPDGSSGSSVNTSAIIAGVLVPVFFIALVVGAYFGYKKWKQHKSEEQIRKERESKGQADDGSKRKKANEFQKSRAESKMDKEALE